MSKTKDMVIDNQNRIKINKKKIKSDSLEEVLASANAAYDKHKQENPSLYAEDQRVHFVTGWLRQAYENLYNKINS